MNETRLRSFLRGDKSPGAIDARRHKKPIEPRSVIRQQDDRPGGVKNRNILGAKPEQQPQNETHYCFHSESPGLTRRLRIKSIGRKMISTNVITTETRPSTLSNGILPFPIQLKPPGNEVAFSRKRRGGNNAAITRNELRDSRTTNFKDRQLVFGCAHRANPRVQIVFVPPPIAEIHRRKDQRLRSLLNQIVRDSRVACIVTNPDTQLAPRRVPEFLTRSRGSVLHQLNRHALGLLECNLTVGTYRKGGVVILRDC